MKQSLELESVALGDGLKVEIGGGGALVQEHIGALEGCLSPSLHPESPTK